MANSLNLTRSEQILKAHIFQISSKANVLVCSSKCVVCLVVFLNQVLEKFLYNVTKVYGFYFKPIVPLYFPTSPHVFILKLRFIAF